MNTAEPATSTLAPARTTRGGGLRRDAAVDLDVDRPRADQGAQAAILSIAAGMKALAAEAGIDRHDQDEIDESMTCSTLETGVPGFKLTTDLLAERADRLQRTVHVGACLHMHGDDVGAGLGEGFEVGIARRDHQVHVERLLGNRPDRLHHVGADGDIGHEVPVHHVDMDPVGAGGFDCADFIAQFGEIGRQNRRRDE